VSLLSIYTEYLSIQLKSCDEKIPHLFHHVHRSSSCKGMMLDTFLSGLWLVEFTGELDIPIESFERSPCSDWHAVLGCKRRGEFK